VSDCMNSKVVKGTKTFRIKTTGIISGLRFLISFLFSFYVALVWAYVSTKQIKHFSEHTTNVTI
jgi:hypothetical protein